MNIERAKQEIKSTIQMYLSKNEYGDYEVDIARQRPIFLLGAPGIGKTAIVNQIAKEMNLAFVSYTITHHTRQSAIGLPYIDKKVFGGQEFTVTSYTISEIIAEIYERIEKFNQKEGILFIDEINCVSETLAPAMLELLQNKRFGSHYIPKGWLIISAGNPMEYNKSVVSFDVVTLDRLKKIEVQTDLKSFKIYAERMNMDSSIISYLSVKKDSLFKVARTVTGYEFVTPRGWEDLSIVLKSYEKNNIEVNLELIEQYIQAKDIAGEFFRFYILYMKYRKLYNIENILLGDYKQDSIRLREASFDEKYALIDMLSSKVRELTNKAMLLNQAIEQVKKIAETAKKAKNGVDVVAIELSKFLQQVEDPNTQNTEKQKIRIIISMLKNQDLTAELDKNQEKLNNLAEESKAKITNVFVFIDEVFAESQEMVAFMIGLINDYNFIMFVSKYKLEIFYKYNKLLLIDKQNEDIKSQISKII